MNSRINRRISRAALVSSSLQRSTKASRSPLSNLRTNWLFFFPVALPSFFVTLFCPGFLEVFNIHCIYNA